MVDVQANSNGATDVKPNQEIEMTIKDMKTILNTLDFKELLTYYCQKLKDFCKFFKFPKQVEFSSVLIFRKFYERCSVLINPKIVLISSLFLAGKVENLKVVSGIIIRLPNTFRFCFCGIPLLLYLLIPGLERVSIEDP